MNSFSQMNIFVKSLAMWKERSAGRLYKPINPDPAVSARTKNSSRLKVNQQGSAAGNFRTQSPAGGMTFGTGRYPGLMAEWFDWRLQPTSQTERNLKKG